MSRGNRLGGGRGLVAIAMLGLLPLLLLCNCSRATPTPQATTVRFACLDEDLGYYESIAQAFNAAHPNIVVRLLPKRSAAMATLGPGDADVLVVSLPLSPWIERGNLQVLDGWMAGTSPPIKDDLYPYALAAFTRDGKTWALPIGVDPVLMYYNKTLFDQQQLPYPKDGWTWNDFLESAQKLRNGQAGIYGYGAGLLREEPWLFMLQHGGQVVDNWQKATRVTLDTPENVEALQWYADLAFRYDVAPNIQEARQVFGAQGIYAGVVANKIGLWAARFSARTLSGDEGEVNSGAVTLPRDRQAATLADVVAVGISPQATHPLEAWQWIEFLSQQVPLRMAPARRSVVSSQAYARQMGGELAVTLRSALDSAVVAPLEPADVYRKLNSAWTGAIEDILTGRFAAPETLKQAQQRANK